LVKRPIRLNETELRTSEELQVKNSFYQTTTTAAAAAAAAAV